jgi:ATP-binding cassette, subfamily A (ABC1), member 3
MITGILKPSRGNAMIYGNNLVNDIDAVRQSLGLCQQFDVLYEMLTVREHLELVCELKDVPRNEVKKEVDETLNVTMLTEHQRKLTKQLSGGMKRKLSLGMALIGKSKLIILDEPSSGLDVESRRQIWDLIKFLKPGRSIIMSTQHIEEADELSNRICIMSQGKLLALDTANNIKKRYGVGYNLMIEPKQ